MSGEDTGTLVIKSFPAELHRRLRVAAVQRGCTMGQVIADALAAELDGPEAEPPAADAGPPFYTDADRSYDLYATRLDHGS